MIHEGAVKSKKEQSEHSAKGFQAGEHKDKGAAEDRNKEVEALNQKLEEKENEATANYDRYLRAVAEFDNYKKRALKDKADTIKYANEEIIKDIMSGVSGVIDNLKKRV